MNPIEQVQQAYIDFLATTFVIPLNIAQKAAFSLNTDPAKAAFGDLNSNAPLLLTKQLRRPPTDIARTIIAEFKHEYLKKLELAGQGFINGTCTLQAWRETASELFMLKSDFFKPSHPVTPVHYLIESVSANPTGPLHFGHGRGGIIADVLARVLIFLGHTVTKEFYINDAGSQIEKLGLSFKARCLQAAEKEAAMPEEGYQGLYLQELAQQAIALHADTLESFLAHPTEFFAQYAKEALLIQIQQTLLRYRIHFDSWFSETQLHVDGSIERAIARLQEGGFLYEQEGALWFKSTAFGDDKDRVVRKSNGQWTYVAADIAYLCNKVERSAQHLVMTLGHDHHSYAVRLMNVAKALGLGTIPFDIILYQLVTMKQGGAVVQMSKRAGSMITLDDVMDAVGVDVARFFYLHRKADAQLEFDLELAMKKTEDNPVYYLQYAYVRIKSIQAKAQELHESHQQKISHTDALGLTEAEVGLIRKILSFKLILTTIGTTGHAHLITYYTLELADLFHHYYAHHRVLSDDTTLTQGRLLLMNLLETTFGTAFDLMGISKPERM